jgi:hypothetical protein
VSDSAGASAPPAAAETTPTTPRRAPASRGAAILFVLGLAVYAATRLYNLSGFPIFFFCDEAIQPNVAAKFVANHLRDGEGVLLPAYFLNDQRWAMSLNIYLLAPVVAVVPRSIVMVRATFAIVSLFGAACLGVALWVAGIGVWWAAPLLLAVLPIDFLHARMALETTPAFYAAFLAAYLLYRLRSPRWVFLALLFGAATFYSYTGGQGIMLVTGLLLLAIDAPYHFRQKGRLWVASLALLALLAWPFLREQRRHPGTTREQLLVLHSYWIDPVPLSAKLRTFGEQYLQGFDPRYWFLPSGAELIRHRMDSLSYAPLVFAPLLLVGIVACIARWRRSPGHRVILISPLGVPFAAAAANRQLLRVLPMVVPIVLLTAAGLWEIYGLLRRRLPEAALALPLAAALTVAAGRLILVSRGAARWFDDYGLYGLQYGAKQVFQGIRAELASSPSVRIHLASSWANNPNEFLDFFLTPAELDRARMGDIDPYLTYQRDLTDDDLFVMTRAEYDRARRDPKVAVRPPDRTIPYPDGKPGFYFARMRYTPEAAAIFAAEREERRRPREDTVTIDGQAVTVTHPMMDIGRIGDLFDGQFHTLIRGYEANPFFVDVAFPSPRRISRIDLSLSQMKCDITIEVQPAGGGAPVVLTREMKDPPGDSIQEFPLPAPVSAARVRVTVQEKFLGEPAHIELRDLAFR